MGGEICFLLLHRTMHPDLSPVCYCGLAHGVHKFCTPGYTILGTWVHKSVSPGLQKPVPWALQSYTTGYTFM